uniref:Uncharacterized protein n=1 Tax=Cannabis sativa TaxID=3483 RepID=A0A803QJU7_CANSA
MSPVQSQEARSPGLRVQSPESQFKSGSGVQSESQSVPQWDQGQGPELELESWSEFGVSGQGAGVRVWSGFGLAQSRVSSPSRVPVSVRVLVRVPGSSQCSPESRAPVWSGSGSQSRVSPRVPSSGLGPGSRCRSGVPIRVLVRSLEVD